MQPPKSVTAPISSLWSTDSPGSSRSRLISYPYTLFASCFLLWLFLVTLRFSTNVPTTTIIPSVSTSPISITTDPCAGRYIYIHSLSSSFNTDLLTNCSLLNKYVHMCKYILNSGFGPLLPNISNGIEPGSWYWTNQFSLEIIFHDRMKRYKCLTNDSSIASALFLPYYAGLDVSRYLWTQNFTLRDSGAKALASWARSQPEWNRMWGKDHFLVAGRVAWDFHRESVEPGFDWGNNLMLLPESTNMTILTIEASTAPNSSDLGIPYPTWFHPGGGRAEIRKWQEFLRGRDRPYLFSFAGAPRSHINDSIRDELITQCRKAGEGKCGLLLCELGTEKCDSPWELMNLFQKSVFCLQPPGDTLTRRSTFDGMLAGCIPVFFHRRSAYDQYKWHFPKEEGSYSVFIGMEGVKSGEVSVEERLSRIGKEEVEAMREVVLGLIDKVVYADPRGVNEKGFDDAFDLAVSGVLERVNGFRMEEENKRKMGFGGSRLG